MSKKQQQQQCKFQTIHLLVVVWHAPWFPNLKIMYILLYSILYSTLVRIVHDKLTSVVGNQQIDVIFHVWWLVKSERLKKKVTKSTMRLIDWLIDWLMAFNPLSAVFKPSNGGDMI